MASVPVKTRAALAFLVLVVFGLLLYRLSAVLTPVFFAFLLAYMLDPLVDRFEAVRIPRSAGIAILLALSLLGILSFSLLFLPAMLRDVIALGSQLPMGASRLLTYVGAFLTERGVEVPQSLSELRTSLGGDLAQLAPSALSPVKAAAAALLGGTASLLSAAAGLIIVPVFSFYLLEGFDRIVAQTFELVPVRSRPAVASMAREVDEVVGQFIRGQLTVMAILAALYAAGYALVGVQLAVPIGVIAGLLAFIPYVGGAAALGMALLMCALHYQGPGQLMAVVLVYAVVQALEGFIITPRIVGDKLGLSPVWVLFSLMVGGDLFGFLGVMLALPAAAVVKVFVMHGLSRYRSSPLFLTGGSSPVGRPEVPVGGRLRLRRRRPPRRMSSTLK